MTAREVLIGVTGGIAAYKTAALVSQLVQSGVTVRVAMTASARAKLLRIQARISAVCRGGYRSIFMKATSWTVTTDRARVTSGRKWFGP